MPGSDSDEKTESKMPATTEQASKKRKVEDITEGPQKNDQGERFFDLGNKKRVTIREYKGMTLIDIREFYEDKKSKTLKPGSKGISLRVEQFEALVAKTDAIQKAIDEMK